MGILAKLLLILSFFFASLRFGFTPTVVIDAAAPGAAVSSRASGHLYGLAEAGVPSDLMVKSLDIASVSQKVPDGLQHPIGDLGHVAGSLDGADYLVVYLQDDYSTWYYEDAAITAARAEGTYDSEAFLREDFLPRAEASVRTLSAAPYADRVVYCPFNECDNGVWFGETVLREDGSAWGAFNDAGRDRFFAAWKETCERIRAIDPGAKIGGPGYYEYNAEKLRAFLTFCAENGCVPDVMIYHELSELSARFWCDHTEEYRALEAELGLSPLPVIVTEYGTMAECGNPGDMMKYIYDIEYSGVYGNIAYWRLADNLNDNAADDNMPNACWWLYRWYADLEGSLLAQKKHDLFHGDFGKAVKEGRDMKYRDFYTIPVLSPDRDEIRILCGACDHTGKLRVENLSADAFGRTVRVRIEEVQFRGLTGAVTAPTLVSDRNVKVSGGRLTVKLKDMREGAAYLVTLTPAGNENDAPQARAERIEAESGALLGGAYTYDSAYATTGAAQGTVGGMENPGDGVELTVRVKKRGTYALDLVYGKANDGPSPADRVTGRAKLTVNGDGDRAKIIDLPNTIRSEYTSCVRITAELMKGKNTLRFEHDTGTFVLDSVLVSPYETPERLALLPEADLCAAGHTAYLAAAPEDGYYAVICETPALTVDGVDAGAVGGSAQIYLRRGLNLLELEGARAACAVSAARTEPENRVLPGAMALSSPARLENGLLVGIGSGGGAARFSATVPAAGDYRVTLCYANNQEGGYHAYNVDLIEAYFTVTVNGGAPTQVMCRSTYSAETFSTVTFNATLRAGANEIFFTNDGSVRFDGRETEAPALKWVSVNPARQSHKDG